MQGTGGFVQKPFGVDEFSDADVRALPVPGGGVTSEARGLVPAPGSFADVGEGTP